MPPLSIALTDFFFFGVSLGRLADGGVAEGAYG